MPKSDSGAGRLKNHISRCPHKHDDYGKEPSGPKFLELAQEYRRKFSSGAARKQFVIENDQGLQEIRSQILQHQILGIDTEFYQDKSTSQLCLIQISNLDSDFVLDILQLNSSVALSQLLCDIFCSSSYLKIFHGCYNDLRQIAAEIGVSIRNLADAQIYYSVKTGGNQAKISLQKLVQHYFNITIDKTFQVADWRIRPIPKSMIEYAASDSYWVLRAFLEMVVEIQYPELI